MDKHIIALAVMIIQIEKFKTTRVYAKVDILILDYLFVLNATIHGKKFYLFFFSINC